MADIANGSQISVLLMCLLSQPLRENSLSPLCPTGALSSDIFFRLPGHSGQPTRIVEPGEGFPLEKCRLIGLQTTEV